MWVQSLTLLLCLSASTATVFADSVNFADTALRVRNGTQISSILKNDQHKTSSSIRPSLFLEEKRQRGSKKINDLQRNATHIISEVQSYETAFNDTSKVTKTMLFGDTWNLPVGEEDKERYLQATLQVTYSLSWSHFNNNCEGFNPQLEFSCSEGGLISILDIDNRLTDDPSCVLIDNSGVLCRPSYDASINDGLIVYVDFIFACTGSSQAELHASAVSAGQNLVCSSADNHASHELALLYFEIPSDSFVRDATCTDGFVTDDGVCLDDGFCNGSGESCPTALGNVSATQNRPIPTDAVALPQRVLTDLSTEATANQNQFPSCSPGSSYFRLELLPDNFPAEIDWVLRRVSDNAILGSLASLGTPLEAGVVYSADGCLSDSECYVFIIFDSASDGICCGFGQGAYVLIFGNEIIVRGGVYGSQEVTRFGASSSCNSGVPGPSPTRNPTPAPTPNPTPASPSDPTMRVVYGLVWRHFTNNCQGISPQLIIGCGNGGSLRVLDLTNNLSGQAFCISTGDVSTTACEASVDPNINNALIVDVAILFACDGTSVSQLQGGASTVGQTMTCSTTDNVGFHFVNLSYLDAITASFVLDSTCALGQTTDAGSCSGGGLCSAQTGTCSASSGDASALQNLPIPTNAIVDLTGTPPPVTAVTPNPTPNPTRNPTPNPTRSPTPNPTPNPTSDPTPNPTPGPTPNPTPNPTSDPTPNPTPGPTPNPTPNPTSDPTPNPTPGPTPNATSDPTPDPTPGPTPNPTPNPAALVTPNPTPVPTLEPTIVRQTPVPTPIPTVGLPPQAQTVTYQLLWQHYTNNCQDIAPFISFRCNNGGTIEILGSQNRLNNEMTCGFIDDLSTSSHFCEAQVDPSINDALILDVTFRFSCTGDNEAANQAAVTSFGQEMTCTTIDNIGSHLVNLSVFDSIEGGFVTDSRCSNGPPTEDGFCANEAQCTAVVGTCMTNSMDVTTTQNLPIPIGAIAKAEATPTLAPTASPTRRRISVCFSESTTVDVANKGKVYMKDLQLGDKVLTANHKFESIYSFGHHDPSVRAEYLRIHTSIGRTPLEISGDHMLFVVRDGRQRAIPASMVRIGDVLVNGDSSLEHPTVLRIGHIVGKGAYAPFTSSGTIVVNGLVASSFVAFSESETYGLGITYQWLAHTFEGPHRWYCFVWGCSKESYDQGSGISTWVYFPWKVSNWMVSLGTKDECVVSAIFFGVASVAMLCVLSIFWILDHAIWGVLVVGVGMVLNWLSIRIDSRKKSGVVQF